MVSSDWTIESARVEQINTHYMIRDCACFINENGNSVCVCETALFNNVWCRMSEILLNDTIIMHSHESPTVVKYVNFYIEFDEK